MNVAVVLAGGAGRRFGADRPKQFLDLEGKTVVEHSIDLFEGIDAIDEVCVVVHRDYVGLMREIAARRRWGKVHKIIEGGEERYHSSLHAIDAYADCDGDTNLILHDAARPWLTADIVNRVVAALEHHEAVAVGIPSTDTIWHLSADGQTISDIPTRSAMWRAQTPQAMRLSVLKEAYALALKDPALAATDDCGILRCYMPQVAIYVVEGSEQNRKITFKNDL